MRFYTLEKENRMFPAVSFDKGFTIYALKDLGFDFTDMNAVICDMTPKQYSFLHDMGTRSHSFTPINWNDVTLCAPIVYPRQDVICLGINYAEHAKEADHFSSKDFGGERPYTIYFSKRVSKASAHGDMIPAYEGLVDSLDYEAELGVILGKDAKNISEKDASDYIFGYTIINDVSARNLQTRHKQWYLGKSLDGFTPIGPCIVTPDEIGDATSLSISCSVNGELRQNSNTGYMIQTVNGAIAELSVGMTLQAGTIIATGTPSGVGMGFEPPKFLKKGDTISCKIENIGELTNTVG